MFLVKKDTAVAATLHMNFSGELAFQKIQKLMAKENVQCTKLTHRHSLAIFAGNPAVPRGPSRTKSTTRSKFTTCSEFTTRSDFAIMISWVSQAFPSQRRVHSVVNRGDMEGKEVIEKTLIIID